jgi:hypothetical protein
MKAQEFKDTRTGEIVTQFNIMDIKFMEKVVTTNGDTVSERQAKREEIAEVIQSEDCTLEDIEDIVGDGDFMDYI